MPTTTIKETVALDAWVALLRGHAALVRELNAELQRDHGLTINDYEALLLLANAGGRRLRRTDLARSLALTPSGVTRLLDGLEAAGLVGSETCASDGRVTYAVLTEPGSEKLAAASCSHVAAIETLFGERYSEAEVASLAELLGRLPGVPLPACRAPS